MNKIITGNILDIQEGIICHQVNCQRVAGAGLALQIRQKFPDWYVYFKNTVPQLGSITIWQATDTLFVASLYSQYHYRTIGNKTDYRALEKCLVDIFGNSRGKQVYIPYGVGCGLAGGDWNIVSDIIERTIPDAIIVKLP